jgi:formate dehydrogenase maturation protein FdhE
MNELKALAMQLATIRAKVKAQGGFVGDRDLHQCPACGLMEDVLYGGKLVTYWWQSAQPVDTGLRFKEVGAHQLACPSCGCVL